MTWHVEIPRPHVERYCLRCARTWGYTSPKQYAVVSPTGVCHIGEDDGKTSCGIDATGDAWWWPL